MASASNDLHDEDLAIYGEYLENIHEDMKTRFSDLLMMEVNIADIDISLQEPSIELRSDEIMHAKFKDRKYNV